MGRVPGRGGAAPPGSAVRIADVARHLVHLLGTRLTAFIAGTNAETVDGWGRRRAGRWGGGGGGVPTG